MISRELEILNIIYRLGGQGSLRIISKETCLSPDYAFLISQGLLNQKLIRKIANNAFSLTNNGRSLIENTRGDLKGQKTPTLIDVSRSFSTEVEPPAFTPEIHFIRKEFISEEPPLTEHNLDKGLITEVADARSIHKNIQRLTFAKGRKLQAK